MHVFGSHQLLASIHWCSFFFRLLEELVEPGPEIRVAGAGEQQEVGALVGLEVSGIDIRTSLVNNTLAALQAIGREIDIVVVHLILKRRREQVENECRRVGRFVDFDGFARDFSGQNTAILLTQNRGEEKCEYSAGAMRERHGFRLRIAKHD